jgi:hypothetical protein
MAKLNSEKQKKSSFYEEKSLVGLIPDVLYFHGFVVKMFLFMKL